MMMNQFALEIVTREFRNRFKTGWDYIQALSEEEYLQLRNNPCFIELLTAVNFQELSDLEILQLSFQNDALQNDALQKDLQSESLSDISALSLEHHLERNLEQNGLKVPDFEESATNMQQDISEVIQDESTIINEDASALPESLSAQGVEEIEQVVQTPELSSVQQQNPAEILTQVQMPDTGYHVRPYSEKLLAELPDMRLNLASLSKSQHYALERILQHIPHYDLHEITTIHPTHLKHYPNIGAKVIKGLSEIAVAVDQELNAIDAGNLDYKNYETKYVIPISLDVTSMEELNTLLQEDLTTFTAQLTPQDATIFNHRSGFNQQAVKTLQEVGDILGITRERVRQIEADIYLRLRRSLRVKTFQLQQFIGEYLSDKLPQQLPALSFATDKLFFQFLEKISELEHLNKIANPDELNLKLDLLEEFFALNGVEVNYHDIFRHLYASEEVEAYCQEFGALATKERIIETYIDKLLRKARLNFISEYRIQPRALPKDCAAAALLCGYPEGLSWSEIGREVNARQLSRTKLEEERLDNGALGGMKYTYLLDKGIYGNTKFLNLDRIDFDRSFDALLEIFVEKNAETLHLSTIFDQFDKRLVSEYYTLRYMIRTFGEDYGFYFNGKSQVDNVSLNKDAKTIGQEDLIIAEMNHREMPMNKEEIAQLLKSKSTNHASFYLDKLMEEGRVVRIDHMVYTTPEVAYQNVDVERVLEAMQELIEQTDKPIDYSYFEYFLNAELDLNYSMYLYGSIARKYAEEKGWFRKQFLFSNQEIPFTSAADAVLQVCQPESDIHQRLRELKQHIYIDDERGKSAIYQNMYRNS